MKARYFSKVVACAIAVIMTAGALVSCGGSDKAEPEEIMDALMALCDQTSIEASKAAVESIKAYADALAKAEDEEEKKRKEKEDDEDEDDPANYDSTAEYAAGKSADEMMKKYIGTWEQQGTIRSDGNIDMNVSSTLTYVFKSDMTYTAKGTDENGKKVNEKGKWKMNSKKQVEAGDSTLGIDDSGYLLKDTGERDGKGNKIRYAFAKQ